MTPLSFIKWVFYVKRYTVFDLFNILIMMSLIAAGLFFGAFCWAIGQAFLSAAIKQNISNHLNNREEL